MDLLSVGKENYKDISEYRKKGPRLIVFVLGGLTYSEMRSAYEVMKEFQQEVIIGSTHVYNPVQFVAYLRELSKADPKVPAVIVPTTTASSLNNLATSGETSPASASSTSAKDVAGGGGDEGKAGGDKKEKDKKKILGFMKKK
ncbi:Syntaxin-binding protein 3 [Quaeritorhiza haematococci]|nr:Syntaxin-binding protein 3 [Quaeritorhiza haematococci]